jgi:hypothetical protein
MILTNNFHNSETSVYAAPDGTVSLRQAKDAAKRLCGLSGCTCGDVAGTRPSQVEQVSFGQPYEVRCRIRRIK